MISKATARVACLAASLAFATLPRSARAEDDYQTLTDAGVREYAAGNFVEARTLFEQAHTVEPNARTLRALGLCSYELKHYLQAIEELSASLTDTRRPLTPELAKGVEATLARAQRYVGELRLQLQPPDSRVVIDGSPRDGHRFQLDAGEHLVVASAPGHRSRDLNVTIVGLQTKTLEIELTPLEPQVAAASIPRAAQPSGAPLEDSPAITERWWFWTAIAVVAAGTAVGIYAAAASGDESAGTGTSGITLRAQ